MTTPSPADTRITVYKDGTVSEHIIAYNDGTPSADARITGHITACEDGLWSVYGTWEGLDADPYDTARIVVRTHPIAERLKAAITAGVVFKNPRLITTVTGATAVLSTCHVLGRTINVDLRHLGY